MGSFRPFVSGSEDEAMDRLASDPKFMPLYLAGMALLRQPGATPSAGAAPAAVLLSHRLRECAREGCVLVAHTPRQLKVCGADCGSAPVSLSSASYRKGARGVGLLCAQASFTRCRRRRMQSRGLLLPAASEGRLEEAKESLQSSHRVPKQA